MFKWILQFSLFAALVVAKNSSEESGEEMEKSDGLCMGPEEVGTEIFFTLFNEIFFTLFNEIFFTLFNEIFFTLLNEIFFTLFNEIFSLRWPTGAQREPRWERS